MYEITSMFANSLMLHVDSCSIFFFSRVDKKTDLDTDTVSLIPV